MALSEKNVYCFGGIWVYMVAIIAASPANRRAIAINQTDLPDSTIQNNSVCWAGDVGYNSQDIVPGSGPCELCVCNAPDIVCSVIKCEVRIGCKMIQKENQCCPDFKCDCEYNNRSYYNGEKIDTSDTPCRVCYCRGGDVMCSTVGCYERDDCEGKIVPGTCCLKYDHCPPLDENNKNVKVNQIKTDAMIPRAGGRGLQPWPLSLDTANVTVHPSIILHEFDSTINRPELTIIMQRINPNHALSNEENITSEATDSVVTIQPSDAAQETLNTIRIATQSATQPAVGGQDLQESTQAQSDLPLNISTRCARVSPAAETDLVTATFAETKVTDKTPELIASSTSTSGDFIKPLVDMEKSTMAILQQLLDVKPTIEPLTAETNEALETIEPISAATIEQIAAKIAESIATTAEPAATFTQQLLHSSTSHLNFMNLLGNELTVRTSVLQSENASRHAPIEDEDVEIANVTLEEKKSKSAVASDGEATTNSVIENAVVRLVEKKSGPTELQELTNGTVEMVVRATANVTVVEDSTKVISTTVSSSTTQPSSSNANNDGTEIARVVLAERKSSPTTIWEDLGTVLAHVTVSYKEENKVDSEFTSLPEDLSTKMIVDESTSSQTPSSLPLSTDSVTIAAATTDSVLSGRINGTENESEMATDTNSSLPVAESSLVTLSTATAIVTDDHTDVNVLVFNFSQPDSVETTSSVPVNFGIIEMVTKSDQPQNDMPSNTIEFTTIQAADTSSEESSEEISNAGFTSASHNKLPSTWSESTVPTGLENAAVTMTYITDNGYNSTAEVEKVEQIDDTKMAANRSASNEQLRLEATTIVSTIEDQGDVTTNNASTELRTSTSSAKTDDPVTEITSSNEFVDNDTSSSNFIESVTFTNQIRLDVADQLPQSFFVESFLSPLNYSGSASQTYPPNNDFPFEIFFNTNFSDSTSSSSPLNVSTAAANFSDLFDIPSGNASENPVADSSNYTKIFAQKIVVHPVKVMNSVNSVYLSPGLGIREVTTLANSTKSSPPIESNSTDAWNSTETTTLPFEMTTIPFEDTKSAADSSWRNMSASNYKILLDSLTDPKVKPFTKLPKVTGAPLTWLKSPGLLLANSIANLTGAHEPLTTNRSASHPSNVSDISHNSTTTNSDQSLKNESRSEPPQAKVYDPLMPYPEEYPEEYQTIQNGPAIIITRTTYTRIPDVTYTTVTMATLPTYAQVQKAEDGFAQTLFERKLGERSFAKEENADSVSSITTESTNKYFNIDVKKIEDDLLSKQNSSESKSSADRRMPDPPLDNRNYIKSRISVKRASVEKEDSGIPALDETDLKIVQNFMKKHLRLR